MTTVIRLLEVDTYRAGIVAALRLSESHLSTLRQSLAGRNEIPEGVPESEWDKAVKSFRVTYQIGLNEGFEQVREDIESSIDTADADRHALRNLVVEDQSISAALIGREARGRYLPNLVESALSVDLQIVDGGFSAESVAVAPVVTARFEFDEHLAGQDAVTFRIPLDALVALPKKIEDAIDKIQSLSEAPVNFTVPEWARLEEHEK